MYPVKATFLLFLALLLGCQAGEPEVRTPRPSVVAAVDTTGLEAMVASRGMVVSGHPEASRVGMEILQAGGNAVDAAVATAFALAVTLPYSGNLGGGGFIVIHFPDGRATTIDFREVAPLAATRDMFLDEEGGVDRRRSTTGHLASGVPASPAGLLLALERYGSFDRESIVDPAIVLAEDGFPLTRIQSARLNRYRSQFLPFETTTRYFVKPDTSDFFPNEILVQQDLGAVLRRIATDGHDGFYRGLTAELIVAEMERGGGLISLQDLAQYKAVERPALTGSYRDYQVITMAPPSSGGITLLQVLNAMEPVALGPADFQSPQTVHRAGEAMRRSFADRALWLGDPDHVEVPVRGLVNSAYMRSRMARFNPDRVSTSAAIEPGTPPGAPPAVLPTETRIEGTQTTHLSVVDASGMAVSLTTTVNDWYGSKVVVDGAGFFLNNEMDDFTASPGVPNFWDSVTGERNVVRPGARMLSSMTPTIILDAENRPVLVLGTPGGTTIPTTVYQIVTAVLDHRLALQDAVEAPRFHHQWDPDVMYYERGFASSTVDALQSIGWTMRQRGGTSGAVAAIQIVYDGPAGASRELIGARDPRRDITPAGY